MGAKMWVTAMLVCSSAILACRQDAASVRKEDQSEDYSFEAVATENMKALEDERAKLRAAYREEVKQCEQVLQGEWERPGRCCIWTAMGCAEQPLKQNNGVKQTSK